MSGKFISILSILLLLFSLNAVAFQKSAEKSPEFLQKGPEKAWCPVCGMSIKGFYKTSHATKLKDGSYRQYCSIRCLINDPKTANQMLSLVLVVDADTEKLIDARKAYYVIGSKVPGTMTKVSKLAFENKESAEKFISKMGGKLASFDVAYQLAKKSMDKDIAMTNKKKAKKMYPMGKKIFSKACQKDINPMDFKEINDLKAFIKKNNKCGKLKEKQLQAVGLYLWEVVRKNENKESFIHVHKHEKCPVCGMLVYKYPKWAAKIVYEKDGKPDRVVFDGVKDMMKFYFNPTKWGDYKGLKISRMTVSDYYSQKAIRAKNAFYVIGSDVYGPMGNEPIPFVSMEDAKTFMKDHQGREILKFNELTEELMYKLDE